MENNLNKITAVEWLVAQLPMGVKNAIADKINQAKEMEKQQIIDAYYNFKPKQETLEEAAENYGWRTKRNAFSYTVKANELTNSAKQDFIAGAKWQAKRMYSEDEVKEIAKDAYEMGRKNILIGVFNKWFEQFKNK